MWTYFFIFLFCLTSCSSSSSTGDQIQSVDFQASGNSVFYFISYRQIARFTNGGLPQKMVDLSEQNKEFLGMNGTYSADFDELSFAKGYTLFLRRWVNGQIQTVRTISLGENANYFIRGPIQPSADGRYLIIPISVSPGLGEERVLGLNVLDEQNRIIMSLAHVVDPAWISSTEFVAGSDDSIFKYSLQSPNGRSPVGVAGLGVPGRSVRQLSATATGDKIAFVQNESIWFMNADGSGLERLTASRPDQSWPTWSPDGRQIVFVRRACPPVGVGTPQPEMAIVTIQDKDKDVLALPVLQRQDGSPFRHCGPLYWR